MNPKTKPASTTPLIKQSAIMLFTLISMLVLTSCVSTTSKKHIELVDHNISNIQKQVKEVKRTISKTKTKVETIKIDIVKEIKETIKTEESQVQCINIINKNIEPIQDQIDVLELQVNNIDKDTYLLKEQNGLTENIVRREIREYRSKYILARILNVVLIAGVSFTINFTSGNSSGNDFRLKRTIGNNYIPYSVRFYTESDAMGSVYVMFSGNNSPVISLNANNWQSRTFSMRVIILENDLKVALAGTYNDILTVLVTGK